MIATRFSFPCAGSFGVTYASWTPVPGTVLPHSYGLNEAPAASQQSGVPEVPGRALVHEFLKKVLKLSLIRLLDLSDRLDFEPADRMDIVTQVSRKPGTKRCGFPCIGC